MQYPLSYRSRSEAGFTLIELLVTVAIIGILGAIAVSYFAVYKRRTYDARSKDDLAKAAVGEEAYFTTNSTYTDCIGTAACISTLPGFSSSNGTVVSMYDVPKSGATPEYFTGSAYHPLGNRSSLASPYQWNSNNGGLQ